jgi:thiol peroxidase
MAHQVNFKGSPKNLAGVEVKAGAAAPEFACVTQGLEVVTLATTPKKARLFSAVPSLDTPVCSLETKKFDDAIAALKDQVACYTVSLDLPFAQKRYCGDQKIASMQTLSDVHNQSFAKNWGVLLEGLPIPLMARAVFVVDKNNKVTYVEYVSEVTSEPNYDAAIAALKAAV